MKMKHSLFLSVLFLGLFSMMSHGMESSIYGTKSTTFVAPPTDITLCDEDGNNTESIDLSSFVDDILDGYSNDYQVYFFTSEDDANDGDTAAAIDITTPFEVAVGAPAQVWIRVQHTSNSTDFDIFNFTISVNTLPEIVTPTDYVLCNDNGNGAQIFDLTSKDAEILDGEVATITYHETQADADSGTNAIATPDAYLSENTTVYVRVENAGGCYVTTTLNLVVPLLNVQAPTPYVSNCDVNGNGLEFFDLTTKDDEILNGETATVTYYQSLVAAQNGINPIANPQNFQSAEGTIYVRVSAEDCFVIYPLLLDIPLTNIQAPTPLISSCDVDGDGMQVFNLTDKMAQIANGESVTFSFHSTEAGAYAGTGAIANPTSYLSADGVVYVRVEDANGCFKVVELELKVHHVIANNPNPLLNYLDPSNNGIVVFNLNNATPQIIAGNINPVNVTFYTTEVEAHLGTGAIPNPNAYMNSSSPYYQMLYVRVEEVGNPGCYAVVPLHLMVYDFDPAPGCPLVEADVFDDQDELLLGPYIFCEGDGEVNLTLTAEYFDVGDTSEYVVESIPYDPPFPFTGGGVIPLTQDDVWSDVISLGFDFCFFEQAYNKVLVATNGAITFSIQGYGGDYPPGGASGYLYSAPIPYAPAGTGPPYRNSIFGVMQDLYPALSPPNHSVNYQIIGTAPCRTLVFNIYEMGLFSCGQSVGTQTSQIVMYETTNVIEVYIQKRTPCTTFNSGSGLVGIQNSSATVAYTPPGRNTGAWEAFNEAWRFSPNGPSIVDFAWYHNGELISTDLSIDVTVSESTVYVAETVYHSCAGDIIKRFPVYIDIVPESTAGDPQDLIQCNNNIFDLTQVEDDIISSLGPTENVDITYHASLEDLENWWNIEYYGNPITAYPAISNPQTIYVKIQDFNSDCYTVKTFNLIQTNAPTLPTPSNYILCDDEEADGYTTFDLTVKGAEIYQGNEFPIAYYTSFEDAQNELNQIMVPNNYTNLSNPQTIWVGVGSGDCLSITSFDLIVTEPGTLPSPTPIEVCDDNNDGYALFNLTPAVSEINGGDNTLSVYFYTTPEAATAGEGHITNISNFTNTVADTQTLYIRVTPSGQDCPSYTTLTLIVHPKPVIPTLTNYELCDDNGDGFMVFDLTTKDLEILDGSTADLTYHLSLSDAESGENAIAAADLSNFTNQEIHQQTIYVRLENEFGCYDVSQFNIIVRPLPEVFTLEPLYVCNDGVNPLVAPFMLTDRTNAASGGVLGTTVTYHESVADAENNVNALPSPYMGTNNQVVYVRVENQYGCVSYMTLTLMIVEAPVDPVLDPLEYCDPNSDGIGVFDLTSVVPLIENANISPVTISFHGTYDDAFYDANNLTINNDITSFVNTEWYNQTIYIRIEGVTECFTIAELDLIVHDLPQITAPEPLEMCDDDYDGFVGFDLTSKSLEILGNLNPMNHEVSFFVTPGDAHANTNEIVNVTGYINQTENEDTVWVRVDDLSTGCYDVTALTLLVNPLPVVSMPEVPEYRLCDADGDGYVEFDLQTQIAGIINGQAGLTVTFHDTYQDAELNQNAYPYLHTNNEPFIETVFVRVTTEKGCYVITLMDLIADPLPTLTLPAEPVVSCEGDGDGYGMFNLEELVEDMLNGADPTEFEVNFYETYINAQEGQNPISPLSGYQNSTPFVQTIYVSVYNTVSGCLAIYPLTLTVEGAPQLPVDAMNRLPDIELCDDNFDGIAYFDFTEQTNYIMAAQPDTTNLVVTYHLTEAHAASGTLAIATPDHYPNMTTPQTIWVRLENTETGCFDTAWFDIIVNVPLFIPENLQLTVCDADSDGEVFFDLTSMNPAILANASNPNNYQVDFFLNLADAQGGINVIPNPTNFSNQELGGGGVYTIYVRVIDLVTGCESYRAMTIRRAPMPNPMTDNLVALELCDAVTEDDMMEEFDLTVYEAYIRNGDNNLIFTYHLSEVEAWNDENAIATPEAYFTGSTTIYIRIANQPNADQSCVTVIELDVVVNPLPTVAQNYFAICEENSTGYAQFDLNGFTPTLLGPDQNPAEFLVEYYLTLADAENQTNPINQGVPFENTTQGSETIYVHIYNTITECERVAALTLYAEEAAVANPVDDITLCDYDGTNDGVLEINLDDYWKDTVLGGQDPMQFAVTYHLSEADAQNDVNAIANPTAYSNTDSPYSQTIYIRVENTNTLSPCYDIAVAQILIEGLAEPVITSDYTHICVDYDTREVVRTVTLDSNVTDPNYTFEWYHNGTLIAGATGSTYTIEQFGGEGEYYVIATSTAPYFGCSSEPSAPMVIGLSGPATIVEILPTNAFADQQDIIVTVNGYGEYMYQLDNGPLQDTGHFVNVSPGAHVITVYDVLPGNGDVDDYNNCDAIPVENVSVVNYPHYFTPNGDGYHDRWNITGLNAYHNAEIYIFDRYGKLLKQLNPTGEGWDGTYNGTPLPASDYWFKVVYDEPVTDAEGNTTTRRKEFKAHFAIKR